MPAWKSAPQGSSSHTFAPDAVWLCLGPKGIETTEWAARLRTRGVRAIVVETGEDLRDLGDDRFTANPERFEDYTGVLTALQDQGITPSGILNLWGLQAGASDGGELAFVPLVQLVKALDTVGVQDRVEVMAVTRCAQFVTQEETLEPGQATTTGLTHVVTLEHPNLHCRSLDLPGRALTDRQWDLVADSVLHPTVDTVLALRGGQIWAKSYERIRLPEPSEATSILRNGGVYLITGGLGNVGFAMAEHLARTVKARLILLGRTRLPDRDKWADYLKAPSSEIATSKRIQRVLDLETLGAEVLLIPADAADESKLEAAFAQAEARFGAVHGVIHAAANLDAKTLRPLAELGVEDFLGQFHPKVAGLHVLHSVLSRRKCDFCMFTSSLASVLGGLQFGAYSAANSFMDAFAQKMDQTRGTRWMSVNWEGWQFNQAAKASSGAVAYAMTPAEGISAFSRLLSFTGGPQVAVSSGDLPSRIRHWTSPAASAKPGANDGETQRHARPNFGHEYEAPRDPLEEALAEIWQELLGIDRVGVNDDFFELGGHSLLATQLMSRLREGLRVDLPVGALFEAPSISTLAAVAIRRETQPGQTMKIAQALKKLRSMTDSEREQLLQRTQKKGSVTG